MLKFPCCFVVNVQINVFDMNVHEEFGSKMPSIFEFKSLISRRVLRGTTYDPGHCEPSIFVEGDLA
jgi:hypothetical protein